MEVLEGERKINSEKPIILTSFYPFLRHLALQVSFLSSSDNEQSNGAL